MRIKLVLITLILAFVSVSLLNAEEILPGIDASQKLPLDSKVKVGKLDNGVTYYIKENKKPENRAELQIVFYAAAINEDEDQKGLAHFLEHMCFNGTKNFPKGELISFLESTGMRFGADVNASTGFERTLYTLTVPMDKPEMLDKAFLVLEDWAMNVSLDPEEIDKERGVIIEEWRTRSSAQSRVQEQHFPFLFFNSLYADRLPIGDTAIIKNAQRPVFERYYRDWYRPDLTAVIAVGDFNTSEIEAKIKKHFAKFQMPENPRDHKKYKLPQHSQVLVSIAKDKELPISNVTLMYKLEGFEEGTYGGYYNSLKDQVFSIMLNQRLSDLTQKADPPYLYGGASIGDFIAGIRAFNVVAAMAPDGTDKAYKTLLQEIARAKQHGFTEGELNRAKEEMLNMYKKFYNERDKTESISYTREYVAHYLTGEAFPGIEFEKDLADKIIPKITLTEMQELLVNAVEEGSLVITYSAQDNGTELPNEAYFLSTYYDVMNAEIEAYEDIATDKPLMSQIPQPGKIVKEEKDKTYDITKLELSNGAEVYLMPTTHKDDEILFKAWSPGGTSLVSDDQYFTASNSSSIVASSGVSEFDAITLEKMMSGKNVNLSPYISSTNEGFNGSTKPEDLETFMQMLYLHFNDVRKDSDAFQSYIKRSKDVVKNSSKQPEKVLSDTLSYVMGNYHKRSKPVVEGDYDNINLDKALELYNERFGNAGDFKFIFVGNFDVEEMKPIIETYIGSLKGTKKTEKWKDLGIRPPKGDIKKEVKKGIEPKSSVRYVMNGDFDYSREDYYLLDASTEVLNILLREEIREEKGGVYGVGVFPRVTKVPYPSYYVYIYFTTNPDIVYDLVSSVDEVIQNVKDGKFDNTYVEKVQEIQRREWEEGAQRNRFWLNMIFESQFEGEPMLTKDEYYKMIDGLTVDKVIATAKKYYNTNNKIQIVLNPED